MKAPVAYAAVAFTLGIALAVALAPREDPDAAEDGVDALSFSIDARDDGAPVWREGDAWRVQFDEGEPICWLVVTSATDEGYRQGVWCPTDEAALIAAQMEGYQTPWAGNFSVDLAGRGRGMEVAFFDWPLEDGKTWETEWFGAAMDVEAKAEADGRFEIEMRYDESDFAVLRYDYDPALGWWSRVEFSSGYTFHVLERVPGWDEGATVGFGADRFELTKSTLSPLPVSPTFEMREEDDMLVAMARHGGIYVHRFSLVDPDGNTVWQSNDAWLLGEDSSADYTTASMPGTWSFQDVATATLSEIEYLVRGVALEEWDG